MREKIRWGKLPVVNAMRSCRRKRTDARGRERTATEKKKGGGRRGEIRVPVPCPHPYQDVTVLTGRWGWWPVAAHVPLLQADGFFIADAATWLERAAVAEALCSRLEEGDIAAAAHVREEAGRRWRGRVKRGEEAATACIPSTAEETGVAVGRGHMDG
jgi:hypothetical protein